MFALSSRNGLYQWVVNVIGIFVAQTDELVGVNPADNGSGPSDESNENSGVGVCCSDFPDRSFSEVDISEDFDGMTDGAALFPLTHVADTCGLDVFDTDKPLDMGASATCDTRLTDNDLER